MLRAAWWTRALSFRRAGENALRENTARSNGLCEINNLQPWTSPCRYYRTAGASLWAFVVFVFDFFRSVGCPADTFLDNGVQINDNNYYIVIVIKRATFTKQTARKLLKKQKKTVVFVVALTNFLTTSGHWQLPILENRLNKTLFVQPWKLR